MTKIIVGMAIVTLLISACASSPVLWTPSYSKPIVGEVSSITFESGNLSYYTIQVLVDGKYKDVPGTIIRKDVGALQSIDIGQYLGEYGSITVMADASIPFIFRSHHELKDTTTVVTPYSTSVSSKGTTCQTEGVGFCPSPGKKYDVQLNMDYQGKHCFVTAYQLVDMNRKEEVSLNSNPICNK